MPEHFADRLLAHGRLRGTPAAVALDPVFSRLPAAVREGVARGGEIGAIEAFCRRVLDLIAPIVPVVKINSAYFECYQSAGIATYYALVHEARNRGLLVIGDVKRGDVGHSAEMYAAAQLSDTYAARCGGGRNPDAVTVSGYLGADGIRPFLDVARAEGKGLFVLVRTSNPSAAVIQDAVLADGRRVHEALARHLAELAEAAGMVGKDGWSCLGAVVATRVASDALRLREAMPRSLFLVPGYGTQGGTAADFAPYFQGDGTGALIAAGRSVIFAYEEPGRRAKHGEDWEAAVAAACREFAEDVGLLAGGRTA